MKSLNLFFNVFIFITMFFYFDIALKVFLFIIMFNFFRSLMLSLFCQTVDFIPSFFDAMLNTIMDLAYSRYGLKPSKKKEKESD